MSKFNIEDKVIIVDNLESDQPLYKLKDKLIGITGEVMINDPIITFIKTDNKLTFNPNPFNTNQYSANIVMWNDYLELYDKIEGNYEEWDK